MTQDFTSAPPALAHASPASEEALAVPLRARGSNHVGMRQFNERVVLQTIRQHLSLAKADIARLTGLTAQTIGLITTRLSEDDLLLRQERVRGRIGQPSVPLSLNPDGAFSIGIKIGRRSADWLLVDFTGRVRQRKTLPYAFPDTQQLLPAVGENLNALRTELGELGSRLVGVGVAAPFQLGGWHRMLGLSEEQACRWNAIDFAAEVQKMTELPVSFAKDTTAACVAELVVGRGRDLKSFLYLFVDTFVGGGIVLNSHLHAGLHGNAGAVASLPTKLARHAASPPEQLIKHASLWELEQRLKAVQLDPTAAYDERALRAPFLPHTEGWLLDAADALAQCCVSGTAFMDVDAVVIDGSMCHGLLTRLIEQTCAAMAAYSWEGLWRATLTSGSIGSDARALGVAMLPLHANFAPDRDLFLKATS
jgi:predicted NBD/HSP70 family sugar kinase